MNAYRRYAQTQVETASPEKTLSMLLEGALTRIQKGIGLIENGKNNEAKVPLTRAGDIILELERTLRPEYSPELCEQLAELYRFIALRLTMAAAKGDARMAREAERAFLPIVEGFREVISAKTPGQPR